MSAPRLKTAAGLASFIILTIFISWTNADLTPPYFNLALNKKIIASATCGDDKPEIYCKLVGANTETEDNSNDGTIIQGQSCDECNSQNPEKMHPPEFAVDALDTWWQSPPLSRSMKYNEVNLTIDLGQEFHVAYVFVRMGNSPRPGLWILEKSSDYGKTYVPWQYFSDSPEECARLFGEESLQPISRDDSVICSTDYSQIVPLEGGEIPISLLTSRPSASHYFNSSVLQDWTRATNVRFRFLRTKNMLGHLMSIGPSDSSVTRRFYYSIKDISIGGRCMCNGHADTCDPEDESSNKLVCSCQHNTCGPKCAQCCPGFQQKKWRISQEWDRFSCEKCNCHNHSTECYYDPDIDMQHLSIDMNGRYEGGGVCTNCQHNTEGINCNKCKQKYYRPWSKNWGDIDVCQPCDCDSHFSTGNCEEGNGQCECRHEFNPPNCDSCRIGYFDYPNCKPCPCNMNGTSSQQCVPENGKCYCKENFDGEFCEKCADSYYSNECKKCDCNPIGSASEICDKESGNCTCKTKYAGQRCERCQAGFYDYPTCQYCDCDATGTEPGICDLDSGICKCKEGFGGSRCDQCIPGYYLERKDREVVCVPCNCSTPGSVTTTCAADGKCQCSPQFGGKQCDQCSPGHYKYPDCLPCNCDTYGSIGISCEDNGQCQCKPNFDKLKCDTCKELFYNYPACEECNCDPSGVIASFLGCGSVPAGELCQCKERVLGRRCNDCKPLYWNLQEYNPRGCDECACNPLGTQGGIGVCDTKTGQCPCKVSVGSQSCSECLDEFYNLQRSNVFGCTDCDCDVGGAVDNVCDRQTGQCNCHARITGRRCDAPLQDHYFPTLHEMQYELEDGRTPSNEPVRYDFNEEVFPGFSWKSYAVFNRYQNEVINDVRITKSSLYRMIIRYVNNNPDAASVNILITPDQQSGNDVEQSFTAILKPTQQPQFATVTGKSSVPSPFVMNLGKWEVKFKTDDNILIDFFVLIPAAFYEGTVLTNNVMKPCIAGLSNICRQFAYPRMIYPTALGSELINSVPQYLDDEEQLKSLYLKSSDLPIISDEQEELNLNLNVNDVDTDYVLVIQYVTPVNSTGPQGGPVNLSLNTTGEEYSSTVLLENCPYTWLCRQVFVGPMLQEQLFHLTDPENKIKLTAEPQSLAAIHSVVAIPASEWHLDFIKPKQVCISINGDCSPGSFSRDIDAKKLYPEPVDGSEKVASPTNDNTTTVILKPFKGVAVIEGKVPEPGLYVFVVHYYQPDYPEAKMEVTINPDGQTLSQPGSLAIAHCPSMSGCRSYIELPDETDYIKINDNFTVTFRETAGKGAFIYYVLLISAEEYAPKILEEMNTLDHTRDFITYCAQDNFYVDPQTTGFCRDSIYSIVTSYNAAAYPCRCDTDGSLSFECAQFGGQCPCRPNIIGRTCTVCRSGYYGYPNCQPCQCPSGCDDDGHCICPRYVEGDHCERCMPFTFAFNQWAGCLECNCNPEGVVDNNQQCDLENGSCTCRPNVVGRTCNRCVPGNYYFPHCVECHCNRDGTTQEVCDQENAQCFCKKNVDGEACDVCSPGYFNLEAANQEGCTKCFCFGKTSRCTSAPLFWAQIFGMDNWFLANIIIEKNVTEYRHSIEPELHTDFIGAELNSEESHEKIVYFGTPPYYLGARLSSYGGFLNYTVLFTTGESGNAINYPDIILKGPVGYLLHYSIEQPPSAVYWSHSVQLIESEFTTVDGKDATREQFLTTLQSLEGIYIRATYWQSGVTTRLRGVSLDVGVDTLWKEDATAVTSVEQCQCPTGYKGLSCEQCAEGFYRINKGPYGGYCQPCECHGHATTCDVNTGECISCDDNTIGPHCEMCIRGYYGDATRGKPDDCMICACPLPLASNNFANGCDVSEDGSLVACDCEVGYGGLRCEYCAPGYYGNPEADGDFCKPCNCSGNIDPTDPYSCDSVTGSCLKCINNTGGAACNLCAPGFFGDAVILKNCQACDCDEYGTRHCDSFSGICECHEGVVGDRCDRCTPETWGIKSGAGCRSCDCGIASNGNDCDLETGQCECASGVTGKRCEQCASGYWNYTKNGCEHCNCNTGYSVGFVCNTETGQCECLPGAIGDKCDKCPHRWVLKENEGCFECDSCVHNLLDTVEELTTALDPISIEFQSTANSYFTTQHLNYIADTVDKLKPRVEAIDPNKINVESLSKSVESLEADAKNLQRRAEFGVNDAEQALTSADNLTESADKLLADVNDRKSDTEKAVQQVKDLVTSLEVGEQPKFDSAKQEADKILAELREINLDPEIARAQEQRDNVAKLEERVKMITDSVKDGREKLENFRHNVKEFDEKLASIENYTRQAEEITRLAEDLNKKNLASKFDLKVQNVNNLTNEAWSNILAAAQLINNASMAHLVAQDLLKVAKQEMDDNVNDQVANLIDEMKNRFEELQELEGKAKQHQEEIYNKVQQLNDLLNILKNNSRTQDAFQAANSYTSIVEDVEAGKKAAEEALTTAENMEKLVKELEARSKPAYLRSLQLKDDAADLMAKLSLDLDENLEKIQANVKRLLESTEKTTNELDAIEIALKNPQSMSAHEDLRNYVDNLDPVEEKVKYIKDMITEVKELPESELLARNLPKAVDDVLKNERQIKTQLENLNLNKPRINDAYDRVNSQTEHFQQLKLNTSDQLDHLQRQIEMVRKIARSIKVGVEFEEDSTLQPETPLNVDELGLSTHVSAYFNTQKQNGFLLYLGNEEGTKLRRTYSDDYMAIEILNGYPYLVIDIGDGVQRVNSKKYVSDGQWYQVIVDRVGKNVNFTIKEEPTKGTVIPHTTSAILPGQKTIFNLNKDHSKLIVGGYTGKLQDDIRFSSFVGQVEELVIGETPVGLWNFVEANKIKGAKERDILIKRTPTGYRFHGDGYMTISAEDYYQPETNEVSFNFKTFEPEGLLYLISQGSSFFSIEMRGGKVFLQFRLDGDVLSLGTKQKFNDGKFHKVRVVRKGRKGMLVVDDYNQEIRGEVAGVEKVLPAYDHMFFGGYPKKTGLLEITEKPFDGCIDSVQVSGISVDLTNYTDLIGATPGCQLGYRLIVSLNGDASYIRFNEITFDELQLNLKFKTTQPDALLFFITSRQQNSGISLGLLEGKLVLISQGSKIDSGAHKYNDGQWHVVTVTHNPTVMSLVVDDYDTFEIQEGSTPPRPPQITKGDLFLGGVPNNYVILAGMVPTRVPYAGCFGDATFNNEMISFTSPHDANGVTFGRCGTSSDGGVAIPSSSIDENIFVVDKDEEIHLSPLPTSSPDAETETPKVVQVPDTTTATPLPYTPPATKPTPPVTKPTPSTTKRPPPRTHDGCALDHNPDFLDISNTEIYRFGTRNNSRIEYSRLPGTQRDGYDISVSFKTFDPDGGLIFYASEPTSRNLVALFMKAGQVHFYASCDTKSVQLISKDIYNDGGWHQVVISKGMGYFKMGIDEEHVADESVECVSSAPLLQPPFYFGGLNKLTDDMKRNLKDFYSPFVGCLKELKMIGRSFTDISNTVHVLPCREQNVESGAYFAPGGGYVKVYDQYKVERDVGISLEIKPRKMAGVLVAIVGRKHYMILEIIDNEVVLHVDNGKGPFEARYKLSNEFLLCDGQWHKITAVKARHVASVAVDGHFSDAGVGTQSSTKNRAAHFIIGGLPNYHHVQIKSKEKYQGCIRNIVVKEKTISIPLSGAVGNVSIGVCPTD